MDERTCFSYLAALGSGEEKIIIQAHITPIQIAPILFSDHIVVTLGEFQVTEQLNIAEINAKNMVANEAFTIALSTITGCFEDIAKNIGELSARYIEQGFYGRDKNLGQHIFATGKGTTSNTTGNCILNGVQFDIAHYLRYISYYKAAISKYTRTLAACTSSSSKAVQDAVRTGTTTCSHNLTFGPLRFVSFILLPTRCINQDTKIA